MIPIKETIKFGEFDSQKENFYIIKRDAPTPNEKLVTESLNYMNSIYDFSNITGERFYEQRTISYEMTVFDVLYEQRKAIENKCKRLLMKPFEQRLYDSHDKGFYWLGKCKSVKVNDDQEKRQLTFDVDFSLYPFAIKDNNSSTSYDDWNTFNFDNDFIQPFSYKVTNTRKIKLMNAGANSVSPEVIVSNNVSIYLNGSRFDFSPKKQKDFLFSLPSGMSDITVIGTANIRFVIKSEVML
ncbi:hypothetical protein [Leuconostoc citreum]|uniref:hypothetical protein n=1 Tax=Leuconostoc citreum TaxID=33964 RepID=UPI0032E02EA5